MEKTMDKAIITVVGKDTVGIIAKVCTYLADNGVNVLDISQTIVSGFFNMMMIVAQCAGKFLRECPQSSKEAFCRDFRRNGCIGRKNRRFNQMSARRNF